MLRISKLLLILSIVLGSVSSFAIDYVQQELLLEESYVAEETLLLESEKLKSALEKFYKDPLGYLDSEESEDDLEDLNDQEFLTFFRKASTVQDAQGRSTLSQDSEDLLVQELVDRFQLEDDGYKGDNFDKDGIAKIIEYYSVFYPHFSEATIVNLFRSNGKIPQLDNVLESGQVFYVQDLGMKRKVTNHLSLIFADYDQKKAYLFDSIGLGDAEIEEYQKAFGKQFKLYYSTAKIQNDGENCMFFVTEAIRIIAEDPEDFFARLEQIPGKDNLYGFDCVHPEFLVLSQSLSHIKAYENCYDFIKSNRELSLESLQKKFRKTYIKPLKKKLKEASLKKEKESLQYSLDELKSFVSVWLPILHADADYLESVSSVKEKLENIPGVIRVTESGKEQNGLYSSLRMQALYYMGLVESQEYETTDEDSDDSSTDDSDDSSIDDSDEDSDN